MWYGFEVLSIYLVQNQLMSKGTPFDNNIILRREGSKYEKGNKYCYDNMSYKSPANASVASDSKNYKRGEKIYGSYSKQK